MYMYVTTLYTRGNLNITHSLSAHIMSSFQMYSCRSIATALSKAHFPLIISQVCFMHASWRLTEQDGQVGLADLALRNFV